MANSKRVQLWRGMVEDTEYRIMLVPSVPVKKPRKKQVWTPPEVVVEYFSSEEREWSEASTQEHLSALAQAVHQFWQASQVARHVLSDVGLNAQP
jgi:hypothetical protein